MKLYVDGDTVFFDAFTDRAKRTTGFGTVYMVSDEPEEFDPDLIPIGFDRAKKRLAEIQDRFYGIPMLVAVKGDNNFRYGLYPEYKAKRSESRTFLRHYASEAIDMAIEEGFVIPAHGMEADDLVSIWAWESRLKGEDYVVAHIDKDLNCIPGKHYHYRENTVYEVSEEFARVHYYEQILKGDPTDNIPGAKGIGDKRAKVMLTGAVTETELQERVAAGYMKAHPDDWVDSIQLNGSLIHLLRHRNDIFNVQDWEIVQVLG